MTKIMVIISALMFFGEVKKSGLLTEICTKDTCYKAEQVYLDSAIQEQDVVMAKSIKDCVITREIDLVESVSGRVEFRGSVFWLENLNFVRIKRITIAQEECE